MVSAAPAKPSISQRAKERQSRFRIAGHAAADVEQDGQTDGYPLGAVVTSSEIAASFDTGMEFFSTFGGSTVSCAAGLATLEATLDEDLQAHAQRVGTRLLEGVADFIGGRPDVLQINRIAFFIMAQRIGGEIHI